MADLETPNLERSEEELEELTDIENDPRAMGAAEDFRGKLFEKMKGSVRKAKENLEVASNNLEEIEGMVEDLEGEHPELCQKVHSAFDSLDEGQLAIDEAEDRCGRQFDSLALEDQLSLWAACHNRFHELADIVEKQRNALLVANKEVSALQDKNQSLRQQTARLKSENEALDFLM